MSRTVSLLNVFALTVVPALAAQSDALDEPLDAVLRAFENPRTFVSNARFLSAEPFGPRVAGTAQGDLAALYVATQLEQAGLVPGASDGTFLERQPMVGVTPRPTLLFGTDDFTLTLSDPNDLVAWPLKPGNNTTADGDLVFVGYGVRAPAFDWDDYSGASVRGAVVLMLAGDPSIVTGEFGDGRPTYYGSLAHKLDAARSAGAVGVVLVHTQQYTGRSWTEARARFERDGSILREAEPGSVDFVAWLSQPAARRVVEASGAQFNELRTKAGQPGFAAVRLRSHALLDMQNAPRSVQVGTVIGSVAGTGQSEGAKPIVVMSSYERSPNGTAALIAVAAAFASNSPVHRTVHFVAANGTATPTLARLDAAAVIVLDELGQSRDVAVVGVDPSNVLEALNESARQEQLPLSTDPIYGIVPYFESGVTDLLRVNVPAFVVRPGSAPPPADGELTTKKHLRFVSRFVWGLATDPAPPTWTPSARWALPTPDP